MWSINSKIRDWIFSEMSVNSSAIFHQLPIFHPPKCAAGAGDLRSAPMTTEKGSSTGVVLLTLPEDVLGVISESLVPSDLCSLMLTCRDVHAAVSAGEKVWQPQCRRLTPSSLTPAVLRRWRDRLPSYRSLCRFLLAAAPLLGVWVHQNPELGNVVGVIPGFLSVVGCRVIPQELGPLGFHDASLLYTPVFEIFAGEDGSVAGFYLHGRYSSHDSVVPGLVKSVANRPNVLHLEVDDPNPNPNPNPNPKLISERASSSNCRRSDTKTIPPPFSRLAFKERRRLLELVAMKVRSEVPSDILHAPLFPNSQDADSGDFKLLAERWAALNRLRRSGCCHLDKSDASFSIDADADGLSGSGSTSAASSPKGRSFEGSGSRSAASSGKGRSFGASIAGYIKKQMLGRGNSGSESPLPSSTDGDGKHVQLHDFLRPRNVIGLTLRASSTKLPTYRAWPHMPDNRFALYKLPVQVPEEGKELGGLWGGTFGRTSGKMPPHGHDKPGKALFFLLLSYQQVEGRQILIATKILEGTHYVLHPNGSAMFVVKIDEPSSEPFPFDDNGSSQHNEVVRQSYSGEGIANGYGFRYPGSKPGSLYLFEDGRLAFVWTNSKAVLTLQRLDLEELLKKGERAPPPPPIANFVYLTKSYSNVFAGFANSSDVSRHQGLHP